jgi:hypothetical protein
MPLPSAHSRQPLLESHGMMDGLNEAVRPKTGSFVIEGMAWAKMSIVQKVKRSTDSSLIATRAHKPCKDIG